MSPTGRTESAAISDAGAEGRNGLVTFTPIEATVGPAAAGSFQDGTYRFSRKNGPVPGKYRVTIEFEIDASRGGHGADQGTRKSNLRGKNPVEGGRASFEPAKTITVSVSAEGPYEIDLDPTKSATG